MKNQTTSPSKDRKGVSFWSIGFVALVFTFLGIIISSNLDLTPQTVANPPLNIAQTGLHPVVDRDGEIVSPFVSVVEQVKNAVVNISAKTVRDELPWWHQGKNFSTSSGSGFFFRKDGYVLTNNHVVESASELTVTTSTGYEYDATVVGTDPQTDLAVLKIEPKEDITIIPFGNSDEIRVGDWAIAIGNPFPAQGLDRTVTVGVISAKGRSNLNFGRETPLYQSYIQTDASINPGNSGGPLLNLRGECVGVNSAISSPTGSSVGIGFAIPINLARATVPDLIATGHATRGWLGVWLDDLTESEAKKAGLDAVKGVMVDSVFANSPASKAGIEDGDIIVSFNEHDVDDRDQLRFLVATVKSGNDVKIDVVRGDQLIQLRAAVGDRETFLASRSNDPPRARSVEWMGMEIVPFNQELAESIGAELVEGMYVKKVLSSSPASRASIAEGTVILQVNNKAVSSLNGFVEIVGHIQNKKMRIPLIVLEPDGRIARKVIRQDR